MHPLRKDPWFAAQLEQALSKHRDALTPEQIEAFSEKMAWTFANHPAAQRVLARERAVIPDESGTRAKGAAGAAEKAQRKAGEKAS